MHYNAFTLIHRLTRLHAGIFAAAFFFVAISPAAYCATKVLVINNTNKPPYSNTTHTGYADVIAIEAFRRIGIELKLVVLPPERGLRNANAGIEDGDLTRIAGLDKVYPNLVRVPEKFIDWEFSAFSKQPDLSMEWPAIRQRSVGLIKGWKIYENHTEGGAGRVLVGTAEQLFNMLGNGRIDTALYEKWLGLAMVKQLGLRDIVLHEPPLETREMFIYLNKSHSAIIPALVQALKELKQEGFYEATYNEKLLPYRTESQ